MKYYKVSEEDLSEMLEYAVNNREYITSKGIIMESVEVSVLEEIVDETSKDVDEENAYYIQHLINDLTELIKHCMEREPHASFEGEAFACVAKVDRDIEYIFTLDIKALEHLIKYFKGEY